MEEVLRRQEELRVINIGDITDRLLEATDGDMFVAYNVIRGTYEIHSIESWKMNGISCNTSIEPSKLNQELIDLVRANSIKRFGQEIRDNRTYLETIHDNREDVLNDTLLLRGKKMLQTVLGREV